MKPLGPLACAAIAATAVVLPGAGPRAHADGWKITAYLPTGSPMASGDMPFSGAAACSRRWPLGTTFRMYDGAVFICLDRGNLDAYGVDLDLFAWTIGDAYWLQERYDGVPFEVLG